jgi:hypothetical protein
MQNEKTIFAAIHKTSAAMRQELQQIPRSLQQPISIFAAKCKCLKHVKNTQAESKVSQKLYLVLEHRLRRMRLVGDESNSPEPVKVRSSKVGFNPVGLSSTQGWYGLRREFQRSIMTMTMTMTMTIAVRACFRISML